VTVDKPFKRPESVLVLVCTQQGDVLLMERTHPHGFWQSVTGSLHWGERAPSAARRELFEETGLRASQRLVDLHDGRSFPIKPPWRKRYAPHVRRNREHWFLLELRGRQTIRLSRTEHRQYRWLPAATAMQRVASWTNRELIRRWFSARVRTG
jgi:dATP pyrophosphohydrolase